MENQPTNNIPSYSEVITCPCKEAGQAFTDVFPQLKVSLCSTCGMMTTNMYQEGSEIIEKIKSMCPPEMLNISILDELNQRWFTSVIAPSKTSIMYAEPHGETYRWLVCPIVKVLEFEESSYINPETNRPYETRIATELAVIFEKDQFLDAIKSLNDSQSQILVNKVNNLFN